MAHEAVRFPHARAILFDLDGTLADTAPDLAGAANDMRRARGLPPLALAAMRPFASHGARGLIGAALERHPGDDGYEALREEFLERYEKRLCAESRLFDEVALVIDTLAQRAVPWGVVTNKVARFTNPLVELLGLTAHTTTIVCGDTTSHAKPHPEPLLHAARLLGLSPAQCVYVGDDVRDIEAGRAAGMGTVAAAYGYCAGSDPRSWNADALIASPAGVLALLP